MRIRRKPWAKQELEEAKFYIDDPSVYKGKWKQQFEESQKPLYLEIGCGKGSFISKLAVRHQENNYIAADMIEAMLGLSKRNIETEYANKNLEIKNLLLIYHLNFLKSTVSLILHIKFTLLLAIELFFALSTYYVFLAIL